MTNFFFMKKPDEKTEPRAHFSFFSERGTTMPLAKANPYLLRKQTRVSHRRKIKKKCFSPFPRGTTVALAEGKNAIFFVSRGTPMPHVEANHATHGSKLVPLVKAKKIKKNTFFSFPRDTVVLLAKARKIKIKRHFFRFREAGLCLSQKQSRASRGRKSMPLAEAKRQVFLRRKFVQNLGKTSEKPKNQNPKQNI